MSIIKKFISVMLTRVGSLFFGVPVGIITARLLGPAGRGSFSLIIVIHTMVASLASFSIYNVASYFSGKGKYEIKKVIGNIVIIIIAMSCFIILLYWLLKNIISFSNIFEGMKPEYLDIAVYMVPFFIMILALNGIMQGTDKIKQLNIMGIVPSIVTLVGLLIFLLVLRQGLRGAIISWMLSIIVPLLIGILIVHGFYKITISFDFMIIKEMLSYGFKVYLGSILVILNLRMDMLMVGYFCDTTEVGYYSIAVSLAELIWLIPQSLVIAIYARLVSSKKEEPVQLVALSSRIVLFLSFAVSLLYFLVGKHIIIFLYGKEFISSVIPLFVLLPGIVIYSVVGIIANYFSATLGKPMINTYFALAVLFTNFIANILLIPRMGIIGASIASTISYILPVIIFVFVFLRIVGISIKELILIKPSDFKYFYNLGISFLKKEVLNNG